MFPRPIAEYLGGSKIPAPACVRQFRQQLFRRNKWWHGRIGSVDGLADWFESIVADSAGMETECFGVGGFEFIHSFVLSRQIRSFSQLLLSSIVKLSH